jgi:CelD/BcsL family acetyltransferase involved in cellulose biosynthesis
MAIAIATLAAHDPQWGAFLRQQPAATALHHPAWMQMLAACYGYEPFVFALTDDASLIAGLPMLGVGNFLSGRRWVSLPFTDYCPALAKGGKDLAALTDSLVEKRNSDGLASVEVRAQLPTQSGVYTHSSAVIHVLALSSDPEAVFRKFKRTQVQQCILKAERDAVTVRRASAGTDLDVFYSLHLQTRRRLGTPVQPRRYFDLLWKRLIEPGVGFILLAYHGETPLAGAVFLAWNGTVSYKHSASDPAYWRLRPNNLVLWNAIKWGCENGYHTFDFGRTDLDDEGLRAFKNGWGTKEQPLVYSVIADRAPQPSNDRRKRAMAAVIQRSPTWVCRLIGELFYKYAA